MITVRQTDIAKKLNVSRVTVSKALRNHPDISPDMKEKILKLAKKMGYVPNLIARQLNSRRSSTIGIVVPDLENSFFSYVISEMLDASAEKNYHVLLTVSREKEINETRNIENLIGMRVDGLLICLSQETRDSRIFSLLKQIKIPVVFFDRTFEKMDFPSVVFDDKKGAINSLENIIRSGYTKIAHFAGYQETNIGKKRLEGYKAVLRKHGIPVKKEWIIEGGFEVKDGFTSFNKLIKNKEIPEIIFTVNDRVALGVYNGAHEAGIMIPENIGVMGYGFSDTADLFQPSLTIINQDPRKLGRIAAEMLINEINKPTPRKTKKIFIEEEFIWKNSILKRTNL